MTRDEAIAALKTCGKHWFTGASCDSCWANQHQCPPTLARAHAAIAQAIEVGERAKRLRETLLRSEREE